jgi:hypothetical protein
MSDDDLIIGRGGSRIRVSDYPAGFAERLSAAVIASQLPEPVEAVVSGE